MDIQAAIDALPSWGGCFGPGADHLLVTSNLGQGCHPNVAGPAPTGTKILAQNL